MGKFIKYTGPKPQKTVLWLEGRPTWNAGNDFIVELFDKDAARLIKQAGGIFKIIPRPDGRAEELVDKIPDLDRERIEDKPPEPEPEPAPDPPKPTIFGTVEGRPFRDERVAGSQRIRVAERNGLDPDTLEVRRFADGVFVVVKEEEEPPVDPRALEDDEFPAIED